MPRSPRSPLLLAGLLATAGVAHFVVPRQFDATVPRALPGSPRAWTYGSGAVELALAAGIAAPRTRALAAKAAAAFFVGVFPANVKMAVDWRDRPAPLRAAALTRLPLQVPLVLWARGVARGGEGRS
ncbi:membrane protein [Streptomyces regensis]|nr:membrane protein [Streptomyces regensis]